MSLLLQDLSVRRGKRAVLTGLSLERPLQEGTLTALLGANGAGKSTLIHALSGLLPSAGAALLDGAPLLALAPRERARQAALMPQTLPQAAGLTVYELMLGALQAQGETRQAAQARSERVLSRLGLRELALRRMDVLSGGQRQRVALALLLAREARLMLLDEPTSALDLRWQLATLEAVREDARQRNAIAVLALHDLNLALRYCQRVLVLHQGRLAADGAPQEVLTPELLGRVWGIDAHLETRQPGRPHLVVDRLATPFMES